MYFCYQSENAYICYVGHAILSFVCFFRLMTDERPEVQCELTQESVFDFYCQIAIYLRIHFA